MDLTSAIYVGHVVHKRLVPRQHGFKYRVFALALNVDQIIGTAESLRLFKRNRVGLVGFHDSDYGARDGRPVADHIRQTLTDAGLQEAGAQVVLLCYPSLLGFVFNPLSVYFCYDVSAALRAMVYEVSNTFSERTSYVIPVDPTGGAGSADRTIHQICAKQMYVSPFTARDAQYSFHVSPPADDVVVGIAVRDESSAVLKTHFRGRRLPLTDKTLAAMVLGHPLMSAKVVGGIHFEALRLWIKGVPLVKRHTSARHTISVIAPGKSGLVAAGLPGTVPGNINV
jgi:uncharacterized protein